MKLTGYLKLIQDLILKPQISSILPINLQVDISTYCNLKCKMCRREVISTSNDMNKNFKLPDFKSIFDSILPKSVNLAASGEPFLNPQVFDIIKYAKSMKNTVTIVSSNLTIQNKKMLEKIVESGLDILKISIDGASKTVYENIRGKYYDMVLENIKYINSLKEKYKTKLPSMRIDFVIIDTNYNEIVDILFLAKEYKIDYVFYRTLDKRGWTEQEKNELFNRINYLELIKNIETAYKTSKNLGIKTNLNILLNNLSIVQLVYTGKVNSPIKRKVCLLPWGQIFISISGDTSPCCGIYPYSEGSLGNVFKQNIKEIWNGELITKTRNDFKKLKNYGLYENCTSCIPMTDLNLMKTINMFPGYFKKTKPYFIII